MAFVDFIQWAALALAAATPPAPAEAPASAYGMRPLIQGPAGERSVIAIAECPSGLVPIYDQPDWCRVLKGGCRPQKIWILDQTRRGPPLVAHQTNGENIPTPPWCQR
jgi:hypothetical protein